MNAPARMLAALMAVVFVAITVPWLAALLSASLLTRDTIAASVHTRVNILGAGIANDLDAYLETGLPLDGVVGMDDYLSGELQGEDSVKSAVVTSGNGQIIGRFARSGTAQVDTAQANLQDVRFNIGTDDKRLGVVVLSYDPRAPDATRARIRRDFIAALVIALIVGFEIVLAGFREAVGIPLQSAVLLERRLVDRSFDRIAETAESGPAARMVDALNHLIVAINDRYAQVRAHLAEIRQSSFNPEAPARAAALQADLDAAGRFAPEGLTALSLNTGELFAGPVAFRAGVPLGVAFVLLSPLFSRFGLSGFGGFSTPQAWALMIAVAAVASLLVNRLLPARPTRIQLFIGAAAAGLGLVLQPFVSGGMSLAALALICGGITAAASAILRTQPFVVVVSLIHLAVGVAIGGGIAMLDTNNPHFFALAAALVGVATTTTMTLRFASPYSPGRTSHLDAQSVLFGYVPAGLIWAACGYWVISALSVFQGDGTGGVFLLGGLALGAGGLAVTAILAKWPIRFGMEAALVVSTLIVLLVASGGGQALFGSESALIVGIALGIALADTSMILMSRFSLRLSLVALVGLAIGTGLAALDGTPTGFSRELLLIAAFVAATALAVVAPFLQSDRFRNRAQAKPQAKP